MFEVIDLKINFYAAMHSFLTADYLDAINTICRTFIYCFDKTTKNQATARQMSKWFENVVSSKKVDAPIHTTSVFQAF